MRLIARTNNLKQMNYAHPRYNDIDRRLIEVFGEEQCLIWKKENPEFLRYQCFELESGFAIENSEDFSDSGKHVERLESFDPVNFPVDELELISMGVFNPMRYNIKRSYISRKHYSIGNTGKILTLYSGEELRFLFNTSVA